MYFAGRVESPCGVLLLSRCALAASGPERDGSPQVRAKTPADGQERLADRFNVLPERSALRFSPTSHLVQAACMLSSVTLRHFEFHVLGRQATRAEFLGDTATSPLRV